MDLEDFLWNCTDESCISDTQKFISASSKLETFDKVLPLCTSHLDNIDKRSSVYITEIAGSGIFDDIAGTVWEASLILCAYIMKNADKYLTVNNILELGSGVSLPGHLLILLRSLNAVDCQAMGNFNLTLSDIDSTTIYELHKSISAQFSVMKDQDHIPVQTVHLANLDWTVFQQDNGVLSVPPEIDNSNYDAIIGSALCYTTEHVCLADLIKYYLSGRCKTVTVVQINDRPGFSQLISRLDELHISYDIQAIEASVYDCAQHIRRRTVMTSNVDVNSSSHVVDADCVRVTTEYNFAQCGRFFEDDGDSNPFMTNTHHSDMRWQSRLLTTSNESFVLLTAKKKNQKYYVSQLY